MALFTVEIDDIRCFLSTPPISSDDIDLKKKGKKPNLKKKTAEYFIFVCVMHDASIVWNNGARKTAD